VLFQLSYCTEFSFKKYGATSATGTKDFSEKKHQSCQISKGKHSETTIFKTIGSS
jgi:hypothetical protein